MTSPLVEQYTKDDNRTMVFGGDRNRVYSSSLLYLGTQHERQEKMNKGQLRDLITRVLKEVNLYSASAVELLMLTCATESNLGEYIRQVKGPARGIFQMEPFTHDDIWKTHGKKLKYLLYDQDSGRLEYDLRYAIIMTRMHYLRIPSVLPPWHDTTALAKYWKKYYNTHYGKGTVPKAMAKYKKYVA